MNGKKILIIEDEVSISDIVKFNLLKEGYEVETAYDGEEGLKKALGAKPRQIQAQFLIESFILSVSGGIIGTLIGIAVSFGLCRAMGAGFTVSQGAIALGVGFSAAVGIIFGWAPARKASRLNPIDALRRM